MAATYTNNWINEKDKVNDASCRALEKARKQEEKRLKEGWMWVRLNSRTKVFVPCDKKGNPTSRGLEMIREMKKICT